MSRNRWTWFAVILGVVVLAGLVEIGRSETQQPSDTAASDKPTDEGNAPSPTQLLRKATTYLAQLQTVSFRMVLDYHMKAANMNYDMSNKTSVRLKRPNQLAAVTEEGLMGTTIVCDGQQVVQYLPALKRYVVSKAPQQLSELKASETFEMSGFGGVFEATAWTQGDKLYDELMEGVTGSEFREAENIDGVRCHHCRFLQKEFTWDLWIETGERPLIRKMTADMTPQMAAVGEEFQKMFKDAKMELSLTFSDWNTTAQFTDADFTFTPPEGAEKVDSLFEGMADDRERPHRLLGKDAPPFSTVDLNDGAVELKEHLGKNIVMLDFWATWCGPCVEAMPQIARVAEKYANRGVVFYAVNVGEDAEAIREFLKTKEFSVRVVRDPEGRIGELYAAHAIPQTAIIGKDGKVQVVHVGLEPGLENRLTEELEALLNGKDLAAETLAKAEANHEESAATPVTQGVQVAWSVDGPWVGLTVDQAVGRIHGVDVDGNVTIFDSQGAPQRKLQLKDAGTIVRSANLIGGPPAELITFQPWGQDVRAYSEDGTQLWAYSLGQGVDDVWAADLNNDKIDEVIIGYNGSTGLHVLDNQGKPLWTYTKIGNVWHVCAEDLNGDGKREVLTTSATGQLHVFDADGHPVGEIDVSLYANMVRGVQQTRPGGLSLALLGGSADSGECLVAVSGDGKEHWSVPLGGSNHIDSAATARGTAWIAVGMRGGLVYIVDANEGRVIGQLTGAGQRPQVGWLERDAASPLLLVATGKALTAFEIRADEKESSNAGSS